MTGPGGRSGGGAGPGGRSGGGAGPGGRSGGGAGRPHVVVVGGGLAGLAAGLACADGGAAVTLLESQARLGGATWSFERGGRWFDNGQHVFLRCCTAYRGFLDRIGSTGGTRLQDRLAIPVIRPGGRTAWIRSSRLPAPLHLAPALARYHHLGLADRARLGLAALGLARLDLADPALDTLTFERWLARRHQSPAAIAGLWDLIVRPTVNLPASRASLSMATKVFQTGLLSEPAAADIGWARVPLAHLHGDPAAVALARAGAEVRLRAKVSAVDASPDAGQQHADAGSPGRGPGGDGAGGGSLPGAAQGWAVVVDGERVAADAVILAVPHGAAAGLLPPGALPGQPRLEDLGTSPIVDVHVVFDRRVTDLELAAGLGTPVQWVFDRTAAAGGEGQALAVSLSAADEWLGARPEVLIDTFVAALADLFPRARGAKVLDAVVTRERHATFAATPGTAALRPGTRTALAGLALAGAWTDTGWPATMEGAVRSGLAAATQTLAGLGLRAAQGTPVPGGAAAGSAGAHPATSFERLPAHTAAGVQSSTQVPGDPVPPGPPAGVGPRPPRSPEVLA